MKILIVLIAFLSLSAQAQFLEKLCQMEPWRLNYVGHLITNNQTIWNYKGETVLQPEEAFLSLALGENSFLILKKDVLQEIRLTGENIHEFPLDRLSTAGWGKRLFSYGNIVYILRDTGISAFDLSSRSILWTEQLDHHNGSQTVDATTDGKSIYVVMTSIMEGGFNGVAVVNNNGEFQRYLPLKRSHGVFGNNARVRWSDKLYINNSGWMISLEEKQLASDKALSPKPVPTSIQVDGVRKHVSMSGDFYFAEGKFSGCAGVSRLIDGQGRTYYDFYSFSK